MKRRSAIATLLLALNSGCEPESRPPEMVGIETSRWVEGWIERVSITGDDLPETRIELVDEHGSVWDVIVPGSNGRPPVVVAGVPPVQAGEVWRFALVHALAGWTPAGLGDGMTKLSASPRYALNGVRYPLDTLPLSFSVHEAGIPGIDDADVEQAVLTALSQWTDVGCSAWAVEFAGWTAEGIADDGQNTLEWVADWPYDPTVAGMTLTRFDLSGGAPVPDEADIAFNADTYDWSLEEGDVYLPQPIVHLPSVLLHELGHVAGLDHELHQVTSTMFYGYLGGTWMGTLDGDDRRAVCASYPGDGDDCVDDSDCIDRFGDGYACAVIDDVAVCDEAPQPVGAPCSRTDLQCADSCLFTNGAATEGVCTAPCDGGCPADMVCGEPPGTVFPPVEGLVCVPDASSGDSADVDDSAADTGASRGGAHGACTGCSMGASSASVGALGLLLILFRLRR